MSRNIKVSHTHKDHLTRYFLNKLNSLKIANSHIHYLTISKHKNIKNIIFFNNHSKITYKDTRTDKKTLAEHRKQLVNVNK
jgi:hypothetical protein